MLGLLLRVLPPLSALAAGYLLWVGAHAPGGAFQGAALLAAGGVLWHLARPLSLPATAPLRAAVVLGFAVFLGVGVATAAFGGGFLTFPPAWAGTLILLIEAAAMLSIAAIMVALFVGGRPQHRGPSAGLLPSRPAIPPGDRPTHPSDEGAT